MRQPHLGVLAAALIAPVVATLWVWLTARTGLTFHFYPLLIALAPSFVVTRLVRVSVSRPAGMGLVAAGIAAVATGWLTLGVLGARPAATFVEGQWRRGLRGDLVDRPRRAAGGPPAPARRLSA